MNNAGELITTKRRIKDLNTIHLKYVDDLALAEAINMNSQVTTSPIDERPQPDQFRDRTGHKLINEKSEVLKQLLETKKYADNNNMKINFTKTKLMLFNSCHSKDFLPKIECEGKQIELVEQTKLLGLVISSDLSWSANTDYIEERCYKKMWMMRRLQKLGASQEDLVDVYCKQIRSILEFAVPVWNSLMTGEHVLQLERIQKSALHIVLGDRYSSYSNALKLSGLDKLSDRRRKLCLTFAKKAQKHKKFTNWFKPNTRRANNRQETKKFCQVYCKTSRFDKSPISSLTKMLNQYFLKKK